MEPSFGSHVTIDPHLAAFLNNVIASVWVETAKWIKGRLESRGRIPQNIRRHLDLLRDRRSVEARMRDMLAERAAAVAETSQLPAAVERGLYELCIDPVLQREIVSASLDSDRDARAALEVKLTTAMQASGATEPAVKETTEQVWRLWDQRLLKNDLIARHLARERDAELDRKLTRVLAILGEDHLSRPTEEEYQEGKKRYLKRVAQECSRLDLYQLLSDGKQHAPLALPEVYVRLYAGLTREAKFSLSPTPDIPANPEEERCPSGIRVDRLPFLAAASEKSAQGKKVVGVFRPVLLGAPGSGKTTSLRYIAWTYATKKGRQLPTLQWPGVPLLVKLREYDRFLQERFNQTHHRGLLPFLELRYREPLELPRNFFAEVFLRGEALVLLDGLDEAPTDRRRKRCAEELKDLLFRPSWVREANRILVTSRPAGYRPEYLEYDGFSRSELQDLTEEQIQDFIRKYYTSRIPDQPEESKRKAESMWSQLQDRSRPKPLQLARNPMLLTILCIVHHEKGGRLPQQRADLYRAAAECLVDTWRNKDEIQRASEIEYPTHKNILSVVAWSVQQESRERGEKPDSGATQIAASQLRRVLKRAVHEFWKGSNEAEEESRVQALLEDYRRVTGIFNEDQPEGEREPLYAFLHKSFQEYFAAEYLVERAREEADADDVSPGSAYLSLITENGDESLLCDPFWDETLRLASPLLDKTDLQGFILRLVGDPEGRVRKIKGWSDRSGGPEGFRLASEVVRDHAPMSDPVRELVARRLTDYSLTCGNSQNQQVASAEFLQLAKEAADLRPALWKAIREGLRSGDQCRAICLFFNAMPSLEAHIPDLAQWLLKQPDDLPVSLCEALFFSLPELQDQADRLVRRLGLERSSDLLLGLDYSNLLQPCSVSFSWTNEIAHRPVGEVVTRVESDFTALLCLSPWQSSLLLWLLFSRALKAGQAFPGWRVKGAWIAALDRALARALNRARAQAERANWDPARIVSRGRALHRALNFAAAWDRTRVLGLARGLDRAHFRALDLAEIRKEVGEGWIDNIDWRLPGRRGEPEHVMRRALIISMAALYGQLFEGDIENSDLGAYIRETRENEAVFSCGPVALAWHIYELSTGPHEPDPEILEGFKSLVRNPPDDGVTPEMIRLSWLDTLV